MTVEPIVKKTTAYAYALGATFILTGASQLVRSTSVTASGNPDRFMPLMAATYIVAGVIVAVAATALKRSTGWPRKVLEAGAWLLAVMFLLFTPSAVRGFWNGSNAISWVASTLAVLVGVFWAVVFTKVAWFLRSPRFQKALSRSQETSVGGKDEPSA